MLEAIRDKLPLRVSVGDAQVRAGVWGVVPAGKLRCVAFPFAVEAPTPARAANVVEEIGRTAGALESAPVLEPAFPSRHTRSRELQVLFRWAGADEEVEHAQELAGGGDDDGVVHWKT